jgi:hypothetical protein
MSDYSTWTPDELRAEIDALVNSVDRLQEEVDEYDILTTRQGELLHGVANALKGEPGPLRLHDWSDLPAVAQAVAGERTLLRTVIIGLDLAVETIRLGDDQDLPNFKVEDVFDAISRAARGIREGAAITDG